MEKVIAKMKEYESFFKTSFPSFCFMHLPPEKIVDVIDECLEKEKDVYDLGFVSDDKDLNY